jgi:hypothetical protein
MRGFLDSPKPTPEPQRQTSIHRAANPKAARLTKSSQEKIGTNKQPTAFARKIAC